MIGEDNERPKLIYFNIRGNAQVIRSTLLEIGVQFDEIFVTHDGYLDHQIINNYNIEIQKLPYLVHNGKAIHEIYPILKYICIYYNRGDLLGKNLQDSIRVLEIILKYTKEKNNILSCLVRGLKQIGEKKLGDDAFYKLSNVITSILSKNKYCLASQKMFLKTKQFLCGYLTILDFIFYQKCFYYANMRTVTNSPKGQITKEYVNFYESTNFYQNHKYFLEKYQIFVKGQKETCQGMEKMWVGDKKFISQQRALSTEKIF